MFHVLLIAVLGAQPNIFEPKEMSSEVIAETVAVCVAKIGPDDPISVPLCGCVVDAVRLNTKQGLRPPNNNATDAQVARCREDALRRVRKAPKGKTGT